MSEYRLLIAHTIVEALREQFPDLEPIDNERGDCRLFSSGGILSVLDMAIAVERELLPVLAPGHTDLMVSPETIDAMLSAAPPAPTREEVARIIDPVVGCDRSDVPGLRHEETLDEREADAYAKADAILSLLGRPE